MGLDPLRASRTNQAGRARSTEHPYLIGSSDEGQRPGPPLDPLPAGAPIGYFRDMKLGPGLTFSWKRALGVTSAKRRISRATGIPLSRSGRRAKLGRILGMK